MEKDIIEPKAVPTGSADPVPDYGEAEPTRASFGRRFIDSFKRDPNASITGASGTKHFDIEHAAENTASSPLHRRLKSRHLQMIAIGGSIGKALKCRLMFLITCWICRADLPKALVFSLALVPCWRQVAQLPSSSRTF